MFWKNDEKINTIEERLDLQLGFIKELRQDFQKLWECNKNITDTDAKKIEAITSLLEETDVLNKKFKDLETMCLTTISQIQNVQLAHAERLMNGKSMVGNVRLD